MKLIAVGVDRDSLNQALSCSLAYSHLALANYLIRQGAQLTWGNNDPLRYAVMNGEIAATQFCLAHGIEINAEDGLIIREAAISMPPDFIAWLIEHGADVNIKGCQALINAITYQRLENVRVLLEHGANPCLNKQQALREAQSRMVRGNQLTVDIKRLVSKAAKSYPVD